MVSGIDARSTLSLIFTHQFRHTGTYSSSTMQPPQRLPGPASGVPGAGQGCNLGVSATRMTEVAKAALSLNEGPQYRYHLGQAGSGDICDVAHDAAGMSVGSVLAEPRPDAVTPQKSSRNVIAKWGSAVHMKCGQ